MAIRLRTLLPFLHLLLLQETVVMLGEAALCEAPSTLFRGACLSNRNCANICEKEGFLNGRCKVLKCKCTKDCTAGGGGSGGGPPNEGPPPEGGESPPNEGPPDSGGSPPEGGESPPNEGPPDTGGSPPDGSEGRPNKGPPCDHPKPPSAGPHKRK